ncbi:hypothetical protein T05_16318 [Trichinella murrelli]|uniref:Uncharacterized protein n=1 Tax=Trichinella murrelli TaxID=144512 RepID=A0A0V0TU01_9BILA|nr:hypothetical protein T05_16318 [Trichinella murrelli]
MILFQKIEIQFSFSPIQIVQVDSSVAMFMLSVVLFGTLVNYGMASNVGRGNWIPVYPLIPIGEKEPEFTQRPRPAPASTTPPARTEAVVSDVKIAHVGREYRRHTSQDPFYADIPDQEIDYIPTSGAESSCKRHEHCYEKREPSEWCILQAGIKYTLIATAVRTNVARQFLLRKGQSFKFYNETRNCSEKAADVSDGGICDKVAKILTGTDEEAASILEMIPGSLSDRWRLG